MDDMAVATETSLASTTRSPTIQRLIALIKTILPINRAIGCAIPTVIAIATIPNMLIPHVLVYVLVPNVLIPTDIDFM